MKKKLLITRNIYKRAATWASNLFFCVADLGKVESMYQFSLKWYIELFKSCLVSENTEKEKRVNDMVQNITKNVFDGIIDSLFE